MLLAPPVLKGNGFLFGPIKFTFADNPLWRSAITSIQATINSRPDNAREIVSYLPKNVDEIGFSNSIGYTTSGTFVWTIKATGYEDVVVTVDIN